MINLKKMNIWPEPEQLVAFLALFFAISAFIYRIYKFDWFNIIATLVSSSAIVFILRHFSLFFNKEVDDRLDEAVDNHRRNRMFTMLSGLVYSLVLLVVWKYRSDASIISPWELLPIWIFILYFLAVFFQFLSSGYAGRLFFIVLFTSLSVIPIIYTLGYGYDFFIHEASLREIMSHGAVLPKTNFYLGQYSLVLIFHKLLAIPYSILHLWLVPAASAIALSWVIIKNYKSENERIGWLLLLIFPHAFLTFTTPQNFGLLLLLAEVIILAKPTRNNLLLSAGLVLLNLSIHPISGIPALALLLLTVLVRQEKTKRLAFAMIAALPLAIPALMLMTKAAVWSGLRQVGGLVTATPFVLYGSENIFLNFTYSYYSNLILVAALLAFAAFTKFRKDLGSLKANVGLTLGLLVTIIAMQAIAFKDIINYEQADYARRILLIAFIVITPIIAKLCCEFYSKIRALDRPEQVIWLLFLSALLTASFYLSYPRHDNYFNSRGLSVSKADVEAVRYIDADAAGLSYVVLANQQVSAASLKEFGFAHYFDGNFYYPIPTTNPLYAYYLRMVYEKPSKGIALEAKNKAGVSKVYFVLNKYWHDFPRLLEEAKLSANGYESLGDGEVYVFSY